MSVAPSFARPTNAPTGGQYTLQINGGESDPLPFDASGADALAARDQAWERGALAQGFDMLPRHTRFAMAACAAVGLEYWGDHPGYGARGRYVWAIDADQQPHIVHVCGGATPEGTAEHMCRRAAKRTDGKTGAWCDKPFINEHGVRIQAGYRRTNGIKDSFRGTHVPACDGVDAVVKFSTA